MRLIGRKKNHLLFAAAALSLPLIFAASQAAAFTVSPIASGRQANGFLVSPGKTELTIKPGESGIKNILIENHSGKEVEFNVAAEDFAPSAAANEKIKLLGSAAGPYSLKDFISPELSSFKLKADEAMTLPIKVSIPLGTAPGGLFGAVIVSVDQAGAGQVKVAARLPVLFFVTVPGQANASASVKSFAASKAVYESGQPQFQLVFANTGNMYLLPYGSIDVVSVFNKSLEKIAISPYYALPDSERRESFQLKKPLPFGYYRAVLQLDLGYGGQTATRVVGFWVLPLYQTAFAAVVGLFLLALAVWLVRRKMKRSKK